MVPAFLPLCPQPAHGGMDFLPEARVGSTPVAGEAVVWERAEDSGIWS